MAYLMGIDLGSTSIKAVVYDETGNMIACGSQPTPLTHDNPDQPTWCVWDPKRIWDCVVYASMEATSKIKNVQEIFDRSDYLAAIREFSTVDQLYGWITSVLRRFMDYTFEFQQVRHSNALFNAQRFIRQHYAEKLTLESIAAEVCLSPGYFSSLFKAEAGESLFAYLNRFRVKRSQQLLLESNASLVDVAHACGFEDQSYFARVFKKYTGVSPGKYRQKKGRI